MEQDARFVSRKIVRLQNFDYSQPYTYFITICTRDKACIFGNIRELSPLGQLARQALLEIPQHHPEVCLEQYVVMPNHIHFLIRLDACAGDRLAVPQIVGLYKAAVSRGAGRQLWQRSFYEHVVRNQAEYEKIWNYIRDNPTKWELDRFYR